MRIGRTRGIRRVTTAVATVVTALGAAVWTAAPAAPVAPDAVAGSDRGAPGVAPVGTYAVGRIDKTFVDDSRSTKAKPGFEGAPDRTLDTVIYYPARGNADDAVTADAAPDRKHGRYPLVLLSHGNDSFGAEYEPLIRQWSSAGYVVAAPDYPLSNEDAPGGADASDLVEQPADASFVVDRVLALSAKRSVKLSRLVDAERVGAAGHSLGALTTYRLVYEACCVDERVKAAVVMSGVAGDPPNFFVNNTTPLLAVHGDADLTIPYRVGVDSFADASPPKFFLTIVGGGHTPPYRGGREPAATTVARVTLDFFDRYLKDDPDALDRLRRHADSPGVATLEEHVETAAVSGAQTRRAR